MGGLIDIKTYSRVINRLVRLEYGIYGDYKNIQGKLYELRFFFGRGYRIYFTEKNNEIILLLNAGDKEIHKVKILKKP
ncbi:type II toxin-antitoxin system RelE/ParE family toxin [Rickettsia endosymbiont of Rhinocyllus conicus]|uniref:type II toxin-antitoxin system RelE/ParE family toxin n=1 Tax=Rickettsia endosymbiont of Rhinocyllus conicus TaxID=3066252 RepID=UPI00313347EC